jgi:hypothetical protein
VQQVEKDDDETGACAQALKRSMPASKRPMSVSLGSDGLESPRTPNHHDIGPARKRIKPPFSIVLALPHYLASKDH